MDQMQLHWIDYLLGGQRRAARADKFGHNPGENPGKNGRIRANTGESGRARAAQRPHLAQYVINRAHIISK